MRPLALAAIAILLGPAGLAAAEFVPVAQLHASSLRASGLAESRGQARAFVYRSVAHTDNDHFGLTLDAGRMHVETDHAQILAQPAGVEVDGALWTDREDYGNATARLESARPHFKVEVIGIPGHGMTLTTSAPCLDLSLPHDAQVQATKFTPAEREPPAASTDGAIQLLPCRGVAEAAGDFLLVLWEATVAIDSPAGHVVAHSGNGKAPARGPNGPVGAGEVDQSDQVYATVTGGHLRLDLAPDADGSLAAYVVEPSLLIHGALQATGATGSLNAAGKATNVPADVALQGELMAASTRDPDGVAAQVRAQPDGLKVNGASFLPASTAAAAAPRPGWAFAAAAVLLVAASAFLALRGRRSQAWEPLRIRVAGHMVEKRYPSPLLWLAYGLQFRFRDGDTLALRASIQFALGRYPQACGWATQAHAALTDPECSAANALLASLAASRLRRHGEAGRWFSVATQANPRLGNVLGHDIPLQRSWRQPSFQRWVRQASPADELLQS